MVTTRSGLRTRAPPAPRAIGGRKRKAPSAKRQPPPEAVEEHPEPSDALGEGTEGEAASTDHEAEGGAGEVESSGGGTAGEREEGQPETGQPQTKRPRKASAGHESTAEAHPGKEAEGGAALAVEEAAPGEEPEQELPAGGAAGGKGERAIEEEEQGASPEQQAGPAAQQEEGKVPVLAAEPEELAPREAQEGGQKAAAAEARAGETAAGGSRGGEQAAEEGSGKPAAGEGAGGKEGVVEEGKISFFYRPKVGLQEAGSLDQVQRFFMLLAPSKARVKPRLAVIGKKRLPSPAKHERFFGFIQASADSVAELTAGLGAEQYETKTRGTRHLAPARALGQGAYVIQEHKGGTNLVYQLEVPAEPGEVQEEFEIRKSGSYVLTVKNPANVGAPGQGLEHKAEFTEDKAREFKGYAWIPARDPQLLEFERAEFLLVGAAEEPGAELGEAKGSVVGEVAEEQFGGPESDEEELLGRLKEEVKAEEVGIETAPVETGEWA